jgi:hypothetical protein
MTYAWYLMSALWVYAGVELQDRNCIVIAFVCVVNGYLMKVLKEKFKSDE